MRASAKLQRSVALLSLLMVLVFVMVDRTPDAGFAEGHRGWVSVHALAIFQKATPGNGFLGYALALVDPSGKPGWDYFDRYPRFFSATMHAALNAFDLSLRAQILLARQIMNLLYGCTLLAAVALLVELEVPVAVAVAATTLAGSGSFLVEYRDMIHFDQPALLGAMVLLWVIARFSRRKASSRFVYVATIAAVVSGRGYASFAVLGVWWIVEAWSALGGGLRALPRRLVLGVPTRAYVLGIVVAGLCLGHNVASEARITGRSLADVGIVRSAMRRLSMDEEINRSNDESMAWGAFSRIQADRITRGVQPYGAVIRFEGSVTPWLLSGLATIVEIWIATRPEGVRIQLLVVALRGLAWIFPMRGLTAFHDYTTMYSFSLHLLFFAALCSLLPVRAQLSAALLGCACLVFATDLINKHLAAGAEARTAITADFERIAGRLEPRVPISVEPSHDRILKGVPFALGFYLSGHPIHVPGRGPLWVTRDSRRAGLNLTPDNDTIFLFLDDQSADASGSARLGRR